MLADLLRYPLKQLHRPLLTFLLFLIGMMTIGNPSYSAEYTCQTAHQASVSDLIGRFDFPKFRLNKGDLLVIGGDLRQMNGNTRRTSVTPYYAVTSQPSAKQFLTKINMVIRTTTPFQDSFIAPKPETYVVAIQKLHRFQVRYRGTFSCIPAQSSHLVPEDQSLTPAITKAYAAQLAAQVKTTHLQINQKFMMTTNQLVSDRVRSLKRSKINNIQSILPSKVIPKLEENLKGQNAGAPDYAHGVWTNLSLTHSADNHETQEIKSLQGSFMAGLDHLINDDLMIGTAINLEYGYQSRNLNEFQYRSTGLGISPYLAYQMDEVFSISGIANLTYSNAKGGGRNNVALEQNSLRWNIAIQGDGFWNWGNWGLLSGVNISYGQAASRSSKDSTGAHISGSFSRLGTVALTLQPSYYWQYDKSLGLEPYLLAQYNYDYSMTKINTTALQSAHPNDPDAFRLGIGVNLFGSSFYSGNIEASTVLGREDYTEHSINANLRIRF